MSLFIHIPNVQVRAFFASFENLGVHVSLITSFIDKCMQRIYAEEGKIILLHSKPVASILKTAATQSVKADNTVFYVTTNSHNDTSMDEFDSCLLARRITVLVFI